MNSLMTLPDVPGILCENSKFPFHRVTPEDWPMARISNKCSGRRKMTTMHPLYNIGPCLNFKVPRSRHGLHLNVAFTEAHMFRIRKVNSPTHAECNVTEDADYLQCHCPRYQAAHNSLVAPYNRFASTFACARTLAESSSYPESYIARNCRFRGHRPRDIWNVECSFHFLLSHLSRSTFLFFLFPYMFIAMWRILIT